MNGMTESTSSVVGRMCRWRGCRIVVVIAVLVVAGYVAAERVVLLRMSMFLRQRHGNAYALLRANVGGEAVQQPSLWRLLSVAWTYRFSDSYKPQGSGGFTGKANYVALLASDNVMVYSYNWSFRRFGLDDHTTPVPIEQIRESDRRVYRYAPAHREQRWGCWLNSEHFNDPAIRFYPIGVMDP